MTAMGISEPLQANGQKPLPAAAEESDVAPSHGPEFHTPRNLGLAYLAIVVCGTLNNFSFCIISGASQDIAKQFDMKQQTSLLTSVMNNAALLATVISTKYLVYFTFRTRVMLAIFLSVLAYAGVAACATTNASIGFWVTALMSVFAGLAQTFGETTHLSFLKNLPPSLLGGWGAGTGIAGIAGSGAYMFLKEICGFSIAAIFSLCVPLCFLYWAAFSYLFREVTAGAVGPRLARAVGGIATSGSAAGSPLRDSFGDGVAATTLPATCGNMKAAIQASGGIMFNLVAVYLLEYTIYPGLADRETLCSGSGGWYNTMWMAYNIGVTISRFSVTIFRIRRVWILTLFQVINVAGWFAEVFTGVVRNSLPNDYGYMVMVVWMIFVGLCGGAVYSNCMHLFNTQERIPEGLRELGINLGFVMSKIGISAATMPFSYYNITFLSEAKLYPGGC